MLTTRQKIGAARVMQSGVMTCRRMTGRGPLTRVTRRGIRWELDLREGIDFAIWLTGAFESATVSAYRKLIKPGHIVLDIGANMGAHSLHLAELVGPQGMVYAFEPTDFAFAKLQNNIALNPELAPRIRCMQLMLLDCARNAAPDPVYASWPLANASDLHPLHRGRLMTAQHAHVATLDGFLEQSGIERVDFMKIDIDGFECKMLRGAMNALRRCRPTIIIELAPHQLDEFGGSIEELVQLFADANYEFRDVISDAILPLNGAQLRRIIVHGGSRNALAIPRNQGNR